MFRKEYEWYMKTVSMVIPVYNTEEFVIDCVQSVFEQTHRELEIILIDNGSNDACKNVLVNLQKEDERVVLYRLDENQGPGYARNFGVQKATGDYVYFLDSDDYLPRETIEIMSNHIGEHPMIAGQIKNTFLSTGMTVVFPGHITPKVYKADRLNLMKNRLALNYLFERQFILDKELIFQEEYDLFCDMKFIISALKETIVVPYVKEAIYFKRKRNDPIWNPSLRQCSRKDYALSFFQMYHDRKNAHTDKKVQKILDQQLLQFYRKSIITYFDGIVGIPELFDELSKAFNRLDKNLTNNKGRFVNRELKAIYHNNESKYTTIFNQHQFLRDLKKGVNTQRKRNKFLYKHLFCKMPVKQHLVFFESFFGKNYSDNPKYIYEYIDQHHPEYKAVWSVKQPTNIPGKAKKVKRFSLRYYYTLARAKYWISNSRMPPTLQKRDKSVYLQTWHGTPLKRLVFDMNDVYSADKKYKENFYNQSRRWDYLNAANAFSSEVFRRAFQYDNTMLEYGYPRNDILYQKNNPEDILKLKQDLGLPNDKKIVLYAPTWRDDDYVAKGQYNFHLQLDLQDMQEKLGSEYIVILRTHYFISEKLDTSSFEGFAYNFSKHDDIAELYLVSDILITDYSSVFFDYANLKRPILFFTYDLEKYRDNLRGFYLDIEREMPGPLLKTSEEVMDAISNINQIQKEYASQYADFYERFCSWDDGNASKNTVKAVFLEEGKTY